MSSETLNEACKIAGSQTNLVRRILAIYPASKIMPPAIWAWVKSGRADRPPADYVLPISKAVDWQITPHQLRPDIYPHPCDGMPKPGHLSNECVVMLPMPIVNETHIHDSEHVGLVSGVVEHLTPPSIEEFNAAQLMSARMDAMSSALGVVMRPMPIVNETHIHDSEHVSLVSGVVEHLTPPSIEEFNAAQLMSARMDAMSSALGVVPLEDAT